MSSQRSAFNKGETYLSGVLIRKKQQKILSIAPLNFEGQRSVFNWGALRDLACPVQFFAEDERSEFNWGGSKKSVNQPPAALRKAR